MTRNQSSATARRRGGLSKLLGAALVSAAFAAPAHAGVIDFEGGYIGPVGGMEVWQQSGFDVTFLANLPGNGEGYLVGAFMNMKDDPFTCIDMACPVNNQTTFYGALNDGYLDITRSNYGDQFQVKSFDASFIGGSPVLSSYPAVAGLLRVQGWRSDGSSIYQDFLLGGPTPGGFTFGHFDTTGAFANTSFIEAAFFGFVCNAQGSCSAFSTDRAQFGIDNIVMAEVPEPSTSLIVGLGLAGLMAAARRRKA
ncbi:NF038120 family PEP-CTERM protein [Massilia horti]|nr:NF038120 family PEP-CTERM protein [Massilia horti]